MDTNRLEQLKEYAKIIKDTPYALKTYLETYDNTQKKSVPLKLFPDQEKLINDYDNYNENITKKYRQAGVSTVTAAWVSKKIQTASPDSPERVLVAANKRDTAIQFTNKLKDFLSQWPDWINVGFSPDKNSESYYRLNNGCEVKAVASSKDALRGYTPTILIFDEAAYIEAGEDFWAASMASLSTGGKIILISTPNGYDPIYYAVYDQALNNVNDFKITDLRWYNDPRYTKDIYWVKVKDIVHYMLNRQLYDDKQIVKKCTDKSKYKELIAEGYKPYSSWFEAMAKKLKYDPRKIAQELECDFLGSGDSVVSGDIQQRIRKNQIKEPVEKYMESQLWVWKEPELNHRYIMGCDVSRGDSEDFSSICIIDFDEREQVMEYIGKIPPDDLANIVYKWATLYGNPLVVTDITGGMGIATSRKLQEMQYKQLYTDGINPNDIWKVNRNTVEKIPGLNFNNKRTQIVAAFEEQLRNGFSVRSERLLNELNTFVYINGRPDHMKGAHDDAIMAMAMALYVGDIAFTQLIRNKNKNKAMLESWVLSERSYEPKKSFYSYGTAFDAVGSMSIGDYQIGHKNIPSQKQYDQYGWLFNKKHR